MNLNKLEIKDFDYWLSIDTRWSDMDSLGHINSNSYLAYMETGRIDTFIQIGYGELIEIWMKALYLLVWR